MMHPISSSLAVMGERTAAKARHAEQVRDNSREFERVIRRELAELNRTRRAETDHRRRRALSMQGNPAIAEGALIMRALRIVAVGLVLGLALHGDGAADAAKKLKNVTRTATVAESGGVDVDSNAAAITGGSFVFANVGKIRRIDQLTVTVTIGDGDTGPGEPKENLLSLALDGIDTGIKLIGFRDSQTDTQTISGAPSNAGQILAALKADGRWDATILDADPNGNLVTLPANVDTTLVLKGKQKAKKR